MSDSSDVEVFILVAVCEEVERKRKQRLDEDIFVSVCNEGEFYALFQTLRKDLVKHSSISARVLRQPSSQAVFGFLAADVT
jgi:hypothetical protein